MWEEKKRKVLPNLSRVNLLIWINVAVFLFVSVIGPLQTHLPVDQNLFSYLALPSNLLALITRFWTPVTYMFLYGGLLKLIFGMLWFYWVGQIFEDFLGSKKVLYLYLFGGLAGALFFLVGSSLMPLIGMSKIYTPVVGAPASVMAVMVGTATLVPDFEISLLFFGTTKLKWIIIAYVLLDLFFSSGPNIGETFTHLGGASIGFIYIRQLQTGNDWAEWVSGLFKPRPKLKVVTHNLKNTTPVKPRQDEIDRILDKISASGYDSLTKPEKETLFRAANDDKS